MGISNHIKRKFMKNLEKEIKKERKKERKKQRNNQGNWISHKQNKTKEEKRRVVKLCILYSFNIFAPFIFCTIYYIYHFLYWILYVWAYGAVETHQTSDLRIVGSIPTMLVFLLTNITLDADLCFELFLIFALINYA